jgi:polyvinyl alcohol dehydrogenase (cytochrome)
LPPVIFVAEGSRDTAFGFAAQLDPKIGGGLFALKLDTGEIAWRTPHPGCGDTPGCSPAQSAAVTAIPGVIFSGGLHEHLRAYSAQDGHLLWDVATAKDYKTPNGVKGHGGALDGPGRSSVGGTLYVNSGLRLFGSGSGQRAPGFFRGWQGKVPSKRTWWRRANDSRLLKATTALELEIKNRRRARP